MKVVDIHYKNWRGETRFRHILPHMHTLRFGSSAWHEKPQWLFQATDLEDGRLKEFAMAGVLCWVEAESQSLPWRSA